LSSVECRAIMSAMVAPKVWRGRERSVTGVEKAEAEEKGVMRANSGGTGVGKA